MSYPCQTVKEKLTEDCILVTRNVGAGKISWSSKRFITKYGHLIKGFVNNGDKIKYAKTFCGASQLITDRYGLTLIRNIEDSGNKEDREAVLAYIRAIQD